MKKIIGVIVLILLLTSFGIFLNINYGSSEVIEVISPTKLVIDTNNNKIKDSGETICIPDLETFSTNNDEELYIKYNKELKLSKLDFTNIGYLADEYAKNILLNKRVNIKRTGKTSTECDFAKIKINNLAYSKLLISNGFAIINNKIINELKFKENLEKSRKLNLVIYNHKSNIYHKLNCEYGIIAHDKILIPFKQLPNGAKACNFCYNKNKKNNQSQKSKNMTKVINDYKIPDTTLPPLELIDGDLELYIMDFTSNLRPNSKCEAKACRAIISYINNAKKSIDIAIYGYDGIEAFIKALADAKNRGVVIRFVYDEASNPEKTYYKGNDILYNIADVYNSDKKSKEPDKIMHNKFIIIDNHIVITGSMNYSKTSSSYDSNDILIIKSTDVAQLYNAEFEQMLEGRFHNSKQKLNLNNKFKIQDSNLEIYFSPKDKHSQQIIKYISDAKEYIYIPTLLITHNKIVSELINAHRRGVDVKVILDANSTNTRHIKFNTLRNAGIPLKIENYAGKLHFKTIIIDDKYLITGSMNLSNSGENHNDENTVIIESPKFAKFFKEYFKYLWTVIPDKYLKYSPSAEGKESIGSCFDEIDNNFNGKIDSQEPLCK